MNELFGPIVYSYTRDAAIHDGTLVDLSQHYPDQCRVYRYPVACTATVWALIEQGAAFNNGSSAAGIVWDIIHMSQNGIVARPDDQTVYFDVIIMDAGPTSRHRLKAMCHPGDRLEPVITIMLSDED